MAELRFSALKEVFSRDLVDFNLPKEPVSSYYSENVFDKEKMGGEHIVDAFLESKEFQKLT